MPAFSIYCPITSLPKLKVDPRVSRVLSISYPVDVFEKPGLKTVSGYGLGPGSAIGAG